MPDRPWLAAIIAATAAWLIASARDGARVRRVLAAQGSSAARGSGLLALLVQTGRSVWHSTTLGPAARKRRARERLRVVHALSALAAELQAGQVPSTALQRCAGTPPVWPSAVAAAVTGGDIAAGLDHDGEQVRMLRHLAACWRVSADAGGGLAASIDRLASAARVAEEVRVELEGQLAGPRATARTLAVLPAVGIGFGVMLGADPLAWLLASTPGRLCLVAGVALTAAGMWWTARIAASVERLL